MGGPVKGKITVAQANIPRRSGLDGFRASMPKVLSTNPDFVTLNEASGWSLAQIEAAAPGYSTRSGSPEHSAGDEQARWATSCSGSTTPGPRSTAAGSQLVDDDKTFYTGPPGHLGPVRHLGDPRARRRRRGLGDLDPPHDQPAQVARRSTATRR